jgi:hypothetical protein
VTGLLNFNFFSRTWSETLHKNTQIPSKRIISQTQAAELCCPKRSLSRKNRAKFLYQRRSIVGKNIIYKATNKSSDNKKIQNKTNHKTEQNNLRQTKKNGRMKTDETKYVRIGSKDQEKKKEGKNSTKKDTIE